MGEKYKDYKISIYEAYFLEELFKKTDKKENPFKIDKNLKIKTEYFDSDVSNEILENLTDGLKNEGLSLKEEVEKLRNEKTSNQEINIENYS